MSSNLTDLDKEDSVDLSSVSVVVFQSLATKTTVGLNPEFTDLFESFETSEGVTFYTAPTSSANVWASLTNVTSNRTARLNVIASFQVQVTSTNPQIETVRGAPLVGLQKDPCESGNDRLTFEPMPFDVTINSQGQFGGEARIDLCRCIQCIQAAYDTYKVTGNVSTDSLNLEISREFGLDVSFVTISSIL